MPDQNLQYEMLFEHHRQKFTVWCVIDNWSWDWLSFPMGVNQCYKKGIQHATTIARACCEVLSGSWGHHQALLGLPPPCPWPGPYLSSAWGLIPAPVTNVIYQPLSRLGEEDFVWKIYVLFVCLFVFWGGHSMNVIQLHFEMALQQQWQWHH